MLHRECESLDRERQAEALIESRVDSVEVGDAMQVDDDIVNQALSIMADLSLTMEVVRAVPSAFHIYPIWILTPTTRPKSPKCLPKQLPSSPV